MGLHFENLAPIATAAPGLPWVLLVVLVGLHLSLRRRHRRAKLTIERVRGERDELRAARFRGNGE